MLLLCKVCIGAGPAGGHRGLRDGAALCTVIIQFLEGDSRDEDTLTAALTGGRLGGSNH